MQFSVCLVLLMTVWQVSAQAPGDENNRCVNQRGSYPQGTRMLMDSRNYEQLITGSSAVWQAQDVDGTGSGVSGRIANHKIVTFVVCLYSFFSSYSKLQYAVE